MAHAFGLAFTLAAPFVIASMLYNLTLGSSIAPCRSSWWSLSGRRRSRGAGLLLLMLLAPTMLTIWVEALHGYLIDPVGAE